MTDLEGNGSNRVDSFITGLSSVNFVFAFAMNLFNFTILYLLSESGIPVIYGGLGISAGQAILLFAVLPMGRLIDRGRSYILMATGAVLYATVLILIFFTSYAGIAVLGAVLAALVAAVLVFQNMFKSSLSSFVAKAVKANIMGRSYSRIIWMETAGGTLSFFLVYFASSYVSIRLVYLLIGVILLAVSVSSFTFLTRENRKALKLDESRVVRPSFAESIRALMKRGRFTTSLLSVKVLMSVGVLGFSYFYLIIGKGLGVSAYLSLLILGAANAIGIAWGVISERFVSNHPNWGKSYIIIMALLDVVSYILILASLHNGNVYLFLAAPIIGSPGPFLIPGALAYEVKVVGKENRGLFSGIQRTLTGIPAIALGAPLTYLFTVNPFYMWSIIVASSLATLAFSLAIPSRKYLEEEYGVPESSASQ